MPTLHFSIDKYQLAYYFCLKHFGENSSAAEWKEVERQLTEKFSENAGFLFFQPKEIGWGLNWYGYPNTGLNQFIRDQKIVGQIFEHIFHSLIFQTALTETEAYKNTLEHEWIASSEKIMELFTAITGLKVEKNITVSVLHPSLEMGSFMGGDLIEWGTPDEYAGSQSVGLAHELMHVATAEIMDSLDEQENKWRLHALIFLSIDEELRIQLGKDSSGYFEGGFVLSRHVRLLDTAKKFMPAWKEYLTEDTKDILKLFEKIKC